MSDYMDRAIEAVVWAAGGHGDFGPVRARCCLQAAEPFIAEHHRADERARVEAAMDIELHTGPRQFISDAGTRYVEGWLSGRREMAVKVLRALHSEPDPGEQGQ